jgi:tetratricopeptide (TPR) repeat protein
MTEQTIEGLRAKPRPWWRRLGWLLGSIFAIVSLGVGVSIWYWQSEPRPEPLAVDLTGADPAVVAVVEEAREGVRQAPRSARAWGHLGMVLLAHEYSDPAVVCLERAEQYDPHEPRWPYYQAIVSDPQRPENAIAKYQRAAELFGTETGLARLRLAEILYALGRDEEAKSQFERVVQEHPRDVRARLGLARLAYREGSLERSRAHLGPCLGNAYTKKAAFLVLAQIEGRLGNAAAADRAKRHAARLPKDWQPHDPPFDECRALATGRKADVDRAGYLLDHKRIPEAVTLLRQVVQKYPDSDWPWLLLGQALLKQNDRPGARLAFREALRLAPGSLEAQRRLGFTLLLENDHRGAAACFRKVIQRRPDARSLHLLGYCQYREGDEEGAIESYRAAVRHKPDHAAAHLDLSVLLIKRGEKAKALTHLRSAVQADPSNVRARQLLDKFSN